MQSVPFEIIQNKIQKHFVSDDDDDEEMNFFCRMVNRRKAFTPFFQLRPLSEILTITNLREDVSRVRTCAESESRLCWMKFCSSNNHYITALQ